MNEEINSRMVVDLLILKSKVEYKKDKISPEFRFFMNENLDIVINANPNIINHNIETVKTLYAEVRPQADYERSLHVLEYIKEKAPHIITKAGIMVGLGETDEQVYEVMDDCLKVKCDIFTIGQYLRPSENHIELKEYVTPEKFEEYKKVGQEKGFKYIASGPLVRSSYKADEAMSVCK